jgi:hypothetical protein
VEGNNIFLNFLIHLGFSLFCLLIPLSNNSFIKAISSCIYKSESKIKESTNAILIEEGLEGNIKLLEWNSTEG